MTYNFTEKQFAELILFMARVNKVTSYYRHSIQIPDSALTTLSNHQIDIDKMLDRIIDNG